MCWTMIVYPQDKYVSFLFFFKKYATTQLNQCFIHIIRTSWIRIRIEMLRDMVGLGYQKSWNYTDPLGKPQKKKKFLH